MKTFCQQLLYFIIFAISVSPSVISQIATEFEEEYEKEFVKLYGHDVNISGIWEPVRSYARDRDRLANISLQVHLAAKMGNEDDEIDAVMFDTRTLLFTTDHLGEIKFDMIGYSIVRAPQNYLFIGKGMKPDCVHHLIRLDARALLFFLGRETCGIKL